MTNGNITMWIPEAASSEVTLLAAATVDIGAETSPRILISGSGASITSFGAQINRLRWVRFNGSNLLIHTPGHLLLPNAQNMSVISGDGGEVQSDGNGVFTFYPFASANVYGQIATTAIINNTSGTVPTRKTTVIGNTSGAGLDWQLDIAGASPLVGGKYGLGWSTNPGNNSGGLDPRPDDVFVLGFGMGGNGAPIDPTIGSCEWHIETNYYSFGYAPMTTGPACWEAHWIVNGTNGVQYRPLTGAFAHNGSRIEMSVTGSKVLLGGRDGDTRVINDFTTAISSAQYQQESNHVYTFNNTVTSKQSNIAGSANLNYPFMNNHDFYTHVVPSFHQADVKFDYEKTLFFADNGSGGVYGQVTLNGATPVTITNSHLVAKSVMLFHIAALGGTQGAYPVAGIPASGACTVKGTAGDTSTYNYVILQGWTPP